MKAHDDVTGSVDACSMLTESASFDGAWDLAHDVSKTGRAIRNYIQGNDYLSHSVPSSALSPGPATPTTPPTGCHSIKANTPHSWCVANCGHTPPFCPSDVCEGCL